MNTDEPGALPMFVDRQRVFIEQNTHDYVVIHKTASGGTAQDIAHFFANDPRMASSHYVIGQDGTVVQVVREVDGAAANCCLETGHASFLPLGVNLNVRTISIEHCDPASDNSTPLTDAQKAASFKLVYDICKRQNIPMRHGDASGGIIGHCDIAPLSRARCPGNYPWDELFTYLENGGETVIDLTTPGVSNYFEAVAGNSNQWQCIQTGKVIQYGILAAYQKYGNSALCGLTFLGLPVSDEVPIQNISSIYQHLAGKGIVVQFFERGVVAYDVAHLIDNPPGSGSVYAVHLYGLPGQDPAIVTLEGQITTLDAEIAQLKASQSPALDPNKVANRLQAVALLAKQQEQLALAPLS